MKKQAMLISVFLVFLISTFACGSSGVVVATPTLIQSGDQGGITASQAATEPPTIAPTATEPPATAAAVGASRSNPAPVGSVVQADNMQFVVTGITRPADSIVKSGNMFNSTAPAGEEYMFVNLKITCKQSTDKQCEADPYYLKALGSDGVLKDAEIVISGVDSLLEDTTFYGGAMITGNIPFIVTKGDVNILLVYQSILGDTFYLSLPAK